MNRTHGFCPGCNEESALDARGACLWCGAAVTTLRVKGRYKRRIDTFLTDDHLRKLHHLHFDGGFSIRELGKRIWKAAGYASWNSAARAIARGFHRLHLPCVDEFLRKVQTWEGSDEDELAEAIEAAEKLAGTLDAALKGESCGS